MFLPRDAWVLSGSMAGWGDPLKPYLDAVVFVTLDADTRLGRLQQREAARNGDSIGPAGTRAEAHAEFMTWARGYDDPDFRGRSRVIHERWLSSLDRPVLRVDSAQPVSELADIVAAWAAS
ncbi:MAG: hypothetical protein ACRDLV_00895 [Solirubrobacteraceae bacterium]